MDDAKKKVDQLVDAIVDEHLAEKRLRYMHPLTAVMPVTTTARACLVQFPQFPHRIGVSK